jgi:hypothetical protein
LDRVGAGVEYGFNENQADIEYYMGKVVPKDFGADAS